MEVEAEAQEHGFSGQIWRVGPPSIKSKDSLGMEIEECEMTFDRYDKDAQVGGYEGFISRRDCEMPTRTGFVSIYKIEPLHLDEKPIRYTIDLPAYLSPIVD